ncbi:MULTISPECIES: bifunctional phosphoribosyl-AMP cyclohydrolase/phosphoribosyl-ATP diphosphatase HisIE [Bacillus]|uniref:bifunctional phosphoribosyl-AMP cyclohydrolase/phosphoribosyl-ATP diphosphatase HisIE n=1 Tax=Bacillus TaxID=1386 RepID=UPI0003191CDB|nr:MULTISPECIES: bifunctional phosphoribosyl-AMP cyclohydrolase/phosphoribosyl-ATP diphosphatase HisIE [Bacillus]
MNVEQLKFDDNGLIPVVVQDVTTKEVLTLAYMNKESLNKSIETGQTWFYSRSRQELWHKGETSGHTQDIQSISYDCDQDALVVKVYPKGPACHTGTVSCFSKVLFEKNSSTLDDKEDIHFLYELEELISQREQERPEGSYTTYLFEKGVDKILKKVGEEAAEVIIAAKNRNHDELKWESADLLFHLFVLLKEQNLSLSTVISVLKERHLNK